MIEVAITGIGMLTPLGTTAAENARSWRLGSRAKRQPRPEFTGTPLQYYEPAVLPPFDPAERLGGRRMLKYMSDAAVLGCIAAREALEDSAALQRYPAERIGLYAATGLAAADAREIQATLEASIDESGEFSERLLGERGLAATNPLISFKILANMPPCMISIMTGIKGPNYIFTPWEGDCGAALAEAWRAVRDGEVDCALAGAADCAAHPSTVVYLHQAGLLGKHEYSASGAAYLVFERADKAREAGRKIYDLIERISISPSYKGVQDPLGYRMGRMFAAAPAILLGLECMNSNRESDTFSICGVDAQLIDFKLGAAS